MIIDSERYLHLKIDGQIITSERFNIKLKKRLGLSTTNLIKDRREQRELVTVL
jgi:hypothetical protein